jgi:CheY-like chemotaxis protein
VCRLAEDQDRLKSRLRAVCHHVHVCSTLKEGLKALQHDSYDLMILDYDTVETSDIPLVEQAATTPSNTQLFILNNNPDKARLAKLLGAGFLTQLFARERALEGDDLAIAISKLSTGDIFGLDPYIEECGQREHHFLRNSVQKNELLDRVDRFSEPHPLPARLKDHFKSVADELITNAVYNAPICPEGQHRYSALSRTVPVQLEAQQQVSLELAFDGHRLALAVTDPFGSLTPSTVLRSLTNCFQEGSLQINVGSGGAGMGLFYSLTSVSQMIINIQPGVRTEMIGILDVVGNYRNFVQQPKSFHLFVHRG